MKIKLDVRTEQEVASNPAPKGRDLNVPLDKLAHAVADGTINTEDTYVVYCMSGARAASAVIKLKSVDIKAEYGGGLYE